MSAAEALVLAERGGVDLDLAYRVIKDGAGSSRMFEVRGPLMVGRRYLPATTKVDVYRKDLAIIKAYAAELDCPTPLFTLSESFHEAAYATGTPARTRGGPCGGAGTRRPRGPAQAQTCSRASAQARAPRRRAAPR